MAPASVEELLHRVNNLLGTIQTQAEVARALGTHAACVQALQLIAESAARTDETVRRFRAAKGLKRAADP